MTELPQCRVCNRGLRDDELGTCLNCINRTRNTIDSIVDLYHQLPDAIATITGINYTHTKGGGHDTTVPGGPALVMLSPGTVDTVQPSKNGARDHAKDQDPNDPPSAAAVLGAIEDEWRQYRNDSAALTAPTVTSAARYLHKHHRWAAEVHEAFPDNLRDLTSLHRRMEIITGTGTHPEQTDVPCLDCGVKLVRDWTEEGLVDDASCPACKRRYTDTSYALAARQRIATRAMQNPDALITEPQARKVFTDIASGTIRTWISRGVLASAGRAQSGEAVYRIGDIAERVSGMDTA